MKVALNLERDAMVLLKKYAQEENLTLGQAASKLIRKGFIAGHTMKIVNGLLVFDLPEDSPRVTTRQIKALEM